MKVLIIGSYGFMMNHLIERLHRERCEIYTVAGKHAKVNALQLPSHSVYEFEPEDTAMKYIVRGVQPDAVVFMGAQDDGYNWEDDRVSSQFSARLNNTLIWAKTYGVKRFIYLSSMRVFDAVPGERLTEDHEPQPKSVAGMTAYSGECLCRVHHDGIMAVTVLRFPQVYGPSRFLYEKLNPIEQLCLEGKRDGSIRRGSPAASMAVYVSDAVDAVYKAVVAKRPREIAYHVEGTAAATRDIAAVLENLCHSPVAVEEKEEAGFSLDGTRFAGEFSYAPHLDLAGGLERTWDFVEKHYEALLARDKASRAEEAAAGKKRWREDLRAVLAGGRRTLENLGLFLPAFLLMRTLGAGELFQRVDFMLLYILITAVGLGVGQSIFAVVLATGANLYAAFHETGLSLPSLIAQYPFIIGFLFYLILAIMISYAILRHKLRQRELEERMTDIQEEYDMLYEVDKTNVEIKRTFERRLLNYGDSIGKIYSIVSELDVLNPDRVVQASLGVVQKIMRVKDVSLYRAGRDNYFHLAASTGQEAQGMKRAFPLNRYPKLHQALRGAEIFVDRSVGSGLPRMAAPVYSGGRLIYIIMLWNMDFEQLSVYQKDLFLVLSRIITASLEKGYQYEEAARDRRNYPHTDVLLPEVFRLQLEEKLGAGPYENADYSLIRAALQGESLEALSGRLKLLIREDDRLGMLRDGDDWVYLLVHANQADSAFVVNKLRNNGIKSEAVLGDELPN